MATADLDLTGAVWVKSHRSNGGGGDCVEMAAVTGVKDGKRQRLIAMRDSKNPDGPVLAYTVAEIEAFVGGVRDGDFDHLTA